MAEVDTWQVILLEPGNFLLYLWGRLSIEAKGVQG
jgi:hypothetical protein